MYRPQKIARLQFPLRNNTIAAVSSVERDVVRLDERTRYSQLASAVRKTLLRADALGTTCIFHIYPDIYTVMRLEAAGYLLEETQDTNKALRSLVWEESHPTMEAALLVYRQMQATEWVIDPKNRSTIETPQDMLNLYGRSIGGPTLESAPLSFRETHKETGTEEIAYEPPRPEDIDELLLDYCEFINATALSPLTQASLAQFQFEAIKPFNEDLDRIERLIMHYILNRRRLVEKIVLPVNLFSAHFKDRFNDLLKPYSGASDTMHDDTILYAEDLMFYTVSVSQELAKLTISLHKMLSSLVSTWKQRLQRVDKGSAIELLLYELAGTPIMTISQGRDLINKSFSATNDAFERLESTGIVKIGSSIRRNRTFEAPEAILLHDSMYEKRATTYQEFVDEEPLPVAQNE